MELRDAIPGRADDRIPCRLVVEKPLEGRRQALSIPGLGDAPWAEIFSALYRTGYDGPIIIEHEDKVFEGTDEKVKRGFLVARDILRPYIK